MGVRHQGIAASLMPANPYACHNYSLQLAEVGRREESYRWADRATVAAPQFGAAHLDCVRRLRQVGRPGQAFAEAQYRCREILDRHGAGKLPPNDWQAPHHAALLIAFAHLDIGRIAEAIELADAAIARLPDDAPTQESFAWAQKRIAHWKQDAGLLARAYAWEGHHRGDPGRVIAGLLRGRITDDDDAMMLIEALTAIGRPEQAELAYWQCAGLDGAGVLGDGKARLAAARALILTGDLEEALDQIQIVQLRRSQSRLEAEINRLLRLAASRPAAEWERVIERRLELGAATLARRAARDLADFVPGLGSPAVRLALGPARRWCSSRTGSTSWWPRCPPRGRRRRRSWAGSRRRGRPGASGRSARRSSSPTRTRRSGGPCSCRRRATATRTPPAPCSRSGFDRPLPLARGRPPTPLAGAYRHIATEALHLVRRAATRSSPARSPRSCSSSSGWPARSEWLLDTWLLRVERALDLEAEQGSYLERHDRGAADDAAPPARRRADRLGAPHGARPRARPVAVRGRRVAVRAVRARRRGRRRAARVVGAASAADAPEGVQLDVHWLAALSHPTGSSAPWLALGRSLLGAGHRAEGFAAACRGITACTAKDRPAAVAALAPAWDEAEVMTPLHGATAFEAGLAAASEDRLDLAVAHLQWALAIEPGNARRAQSLAVALGRLGRGTEALRVLSQHERTDAPRLIGRVLVEAGRDADAVRFLRYAARRFRAAEDWATLAGAAARVPTTTRSPPTRVGARSPWGPRTRRS